MSAHFAGRSTAASHRHRVGLTAPHVGRKVTCRRDRSEAQTGRMRRGPLAHLGRPEVLLGWIGTAVVVGAVYLAVVSAGALLDPGARGTMLPAIAATVVLAAVIGPVQRWCEQRAARVLPGRRTAPYDAMRTFAARLGEGSDPAQLPHRMARLLAEGTGASWSQVWVLVNDQLQLMATHPVDARAVAEAPAVGAPGTHEGMRWVTVGHEGSALGVLRVQERPGHPLTPVEERLFAGLAGQAGLALHAARLRAELLVRHDELSRRAIELRLARDQLVTTQDEERRRLERDIHDGAQQQLVALGINLRLAQTLSDRSSKRARQLLLEQAVAAEAAVETVTSLSRGALPVVLKEHGLLTAFRDVAESSPMTVVVSGDDPGRMTPEIEAALYFCGLEALQNAAKHSGAARVEVSFEVLPDSVRLAVVDQGSGLLGGSGTGLDNMRHRLREIGGSLRIDARPGAGTAVVAVLPVSVGAAR